jgi:predicted 3-demethylubiquinone-9 3-methyltransferase (glyoxalase superfamily)
MEQKITPFLWFDGNAEEAAAFYTSVFKNSSTGSPADYEVEEAASKVGRPAGSVMVVDFEIAGQRFIALSGGPKFKFNESISFVIDCKDQAEVDYYWSALTADGGEESMCGWLKDKFGLSWQVVPRVLSKLIGGSDKEASQRAMHAMLQMRKLDIGKLEDAYAGS